MITIATLLEFTANSKTEEIWNWLETRCNLTGIQLTPLPHFSWQVAENYDVDWVSNCLKETARALMPFAIKGAGLGIFSGTEPVVYYSLVKNLNLLNLHKMLWTKLGPFANELNQLYSPDLWIPHVTLAYKDITPEKLACGIKSLAFQNIEIEVVVNHFAVLYQQDGKSGLKNRFNFDGSEGL